MIKKIASSIIFMASLVFLGMIWWGKPNQELVWFALPFAGLYRQIAGTWWKLIGRIGHIVLPIMMFWFFLGWNWWLLLVPVTYFAVSTLPVTGIGDSVRKWYNRIYVFLLGLLNGLAAIPFGLATKHVHCVLGMSVVTMLIYGIVINLANIDATKKYFPWKLDEFIMGSSGLLAAAMCIDHYLM